MATNPILYIINHNTSTTQFDLFSRWKRRKTIPISISYRTNVKKLVINHPHTVHTCYTVICKCIFRCNINSFFFMFFSRKFLWKKNYINKHFLIVIAFFKFKILSAAIFTRDVHGVCIQCVKIITVCRSWLRTCTPCGWYCAGAACGDRTDAMEKTKHFFDPWRGHISNLNE